MIFEDSKPLSEKLSAKLFTPHANYSIGLCGDLGAGKTHLVKEILQKVEPGAGSLVSSPTFVYRQSYEVSGIQVIHFDLYRVQDEEHLEEIGVWDALEMPGIKFFEWVNRFPEVQSMLDYQIRIEVTGENSRKYFLTPEAE